VVEVRRGSKVKTWPSNTCAAVTVHNQPQLRFRPGCGKFIIHVMQISYK
jgi:hypothetical protein